MPHKIESGSLPNMLIVRVHGILTVDDLLPDLGLDEGPKYLLFDITQAEASVPEDFWDIVRNTPLKHPNCIHAAIAFKSDLLKNLAAVVAKLTRIRDKVTFFKSYDEAYDHLVKVIQQEQSRA
jgi:hypothetical protein